MTTETLFNSTDNIFHVVFFSYYNKKILIPTIGQELADLMVLTQQTENQIELQHSFHVQGWEGSRTKKDKRIHQQQYVKKSDEYSFIIEFKLALADLIHHAPYNTPQYVISALFKLLMKFEKYIGKNDQSFINAAGMMNSLY